MGQTPSLLGNDSLALLRDGKNDPHDAIRWIKVMDDVIDCVGIIVDGDVSDKSSRIFFPALHREVWVADKWLHVISSAEVPADVDVPALRIASREIRAAAKVRVAAKTMLEDVYGVTQPVRFYRTRDDLTPSERDKSPGYVSKMQTDAGTYGVHVALSVAEMFLPIRTRSNRQPFLYRPEWLEAVDASAVPADVRRGLMAPHLVGHSEVGAGTFVQLTPRAKWWPRKGSFDTAYKMLMDRVRGETGLVLGGNSEYDMSFVYFASTGAVSALPYCDHWLERVDATTVPSDVKAALYEGRDAMFEHGVWERVPVQDTFFHKKAMAREAAAPAPRRSKRLASVTSEAPAPVPKVARK